MSKAVSSARVAVTVKIALDLKFCRTLFWMFCHLLHRKVDITGCLWKKKHRKNCERCQSQVAWKVKFKCQFCLSCPVSPVPSRSVLFHSVATVFDIIERTFAMYARLYSNSMAILFKSKYSNWICRLSIPMFFHIWLLVEQGFSSACATGLLAVIRIAVVITTR